MVLKKYIIKLFFLFSPCLMFAQSNFQTIKGIISDAKEGTTLIGVHVTYSDYRYGTITNEQGAFQIKITDEALDDTLSFSFIGYQMLQIPIKEILTKENLEIKLQAAIFGLPSVEIQDISALTIIQRAKENIRENYLTKRHNLIGFYREENIQTNLDRLFLFTEGVLEVNKDRLGNNRDMVNDQVGLVKGYRRKIPYHLLVEEEIYEITPISQGSYLPVRLDVVRSFDFLFNKSNYQLYHYKYEGIDFLGDRILYRIRFAPKDKKDYVIYDGVLYIDKESYAVVKAEYKYNQQGLKFYENSNETSLKLQYRVFSAQYFEYKGFWYLGQAKVRQAFVEEMTKIPIEVRMDYVTTEVLPRERESKAQKILRFNDVLFKMVEVVGEDYWEDYIILKNE